MSNILKLPNSTREKLEEALANLPLRTVILISNEDDLYYSPKGFAQPQDLQLIGGLSKQDKLSPGDNIDIRDYDKLSDIISTTPDIRVNTFRTTAFNPNTRGILRYELSKDSRYVPLITNERPGIVAGQILLKSSFDDGKVRWGHYHITVTSNPIEGQCASIEGGSETNVKACIVEVDSLTRGIYFLNTVGDEIPVKQEVIFIGALTYYENGLDSQIKNTVRVIARA